MELKLNSYEIFELGKKLDERLHDDGITEKSELIITVSPDELKKIDEDLYYRNNPEGKDYIPTEGELSINFINILIKIVAKKEKDAD